MCSEFTYVRIPTADKRDHEKKVFEMKVSLPRLGIGLLALMLLLLASRAVHGSSYPRFGTPIILHEGARAVGDAYAGAGGLATVLDGRYVMGLSRGVDAQGEARIFLWDTNQAQGSRSPVHLTPSLELSYKPGNHLLYAVSPDEHYVAMRMASEWRILTLPAFKVYKSLPVNVPNTGEQIRWSADGRLLAILNKDRSILVWDIAAEKVYQNDAKLVGSLRHVPKMNPIGSQCAVCLSSSAARIVPTH
jgi:hypothetical protein